MAIMGVRQKWEALPVASTILAPTFTKSQLGKTERPYPCSKCALPLLPPPSSKTHLGFKIDFQLLFVLDQLAVSPAQERETKHVSSLTTPSQEQFISVLKAEKWSRLRVSKAQQQTRGDPEHWAFYEMYFPSHRNPESSSRTV